MYYSSELLDPSQPDVGHSRKHRVPGALLPLRQQRARRDPAVTHCQGGRSSPGFQVLSLAQGSPTLQTMLPAIPSPVSAALPEHHSLLLCQLRQCHRASLRRPQWARSRGITALLAIRRALEGARGQPCQTQVTSPPGTCRGACATGTRRVSCTHRHLIFQLCLLLKSICYNFHFAVQVSGSATAI